MKKLKVGDVYYFNEDLYEKIEIQTEKIAGQLNQAESELKSMFPFDLPEKAMFAFSDGMQIQHGSTLWQAIEAQILEDLKKNSLGEFLKDKALESAFNKFDSAKTKFSRMFDLFYVEDYSISFKYFVNDYISKRDGRFIADETKLSELKDCLSRKIETEYQLAFYNMLIECDSIGNKLVDYYNENRVNKASYELNKKPLDIMHLFFDPMTGNLRKNPPINLINRV